MNNAITETANWQSEYYFTLGDVRSGIYQWQFAERLVQFWISDIAFSLSFVRVVLGRMDLLGQRVLFR